MLQQTRHDLRSRKSTSGESSLPATIPSPKSDTERPKRPRASKATRQFTAPEQTPIQSRLRLLRHAQRNHPLHRRVDKHTGALVHCDWRFSKRLANQYKSMAGAKNIFFRMTRERQRARVHDQDPEVAHGDVKIHRRLCQGQGKINRHASQLLQHGAAAYDKNGLLRLAPSTAEEFVC